MLGTLHLHGPYDYMADHEEWAVELFVKNSERELRIQSCWGPEDAGGVYILDQESSGYYGSTRPLVDRRGRKTPWAVRTFGKMRPNEVELVEPEPGIKANQDYFDPNRPYFSSDKTAIRRRPEDPIGLSIFSGGPPTSNTRAWLENARSSELRAKLARPARPPAQPQFQVIWGEDKEPPLQLGTQVAINVWHCGEYTISYIGGTFQLLLIKAPAPDAASLWRYELARLPARATVQPAYVALDRPGSLPGVPPRAPMYVTYYRVMVCVQMHPHQRDDVQVIYPTPF